MLASFSAYVGLCVLFTVVTRSGVNMITNMDHVIFHPL